MPLKDFKRELEPKQQTSFILDETPCKACPLWETSFYRNIRRSRVYGRGTGKSGLLVYCEALGGTEVFEERVLCGDAGQINSRIFKEVGLVEEDAYLTNIVRCRPPRNRVPFVAEQKICMETHSMQDFPKTPPKIVVLMGNTPLKAILNMQKITDKRGVFYDCNVNGHPVKAMVTFHPASVLYDPSKYDTIKEDMRKVKDALTGVKPEPLPKIRKEIINSFKTFKQWMQWLNAHPEIDLTCDLETTGLVFFKDKMISISMVFEEPTTHKLIGIAFLLVSKEGWWHADLENPEIRDLLFKVLRTHRLSWQGGNFDVKFCWKNGCEVTNDFDTIDAHVLIQEKGPHGLKYFVRRYLSEGGGYEKELQASVQEKGAYHTAPPHLLLDYNIDDSYYDELVKRVFIKRMNESNMTDFFYKHQMPTKRSLTRMSYRGFMVDRERVMFLSKKYRAQIQDIQTKLFDSVNREFDWKSDEDLGTFLHKDLGLEVLRRTPKTDIPATDKATLRELQDKTKHPAIASILEIKHLGKMIRDYLDGDDGVTKEEDKKRQTGIIQYLDENDRAHCNLKTHGTLSGRPSGAQPALLTVVKDPEIRGCFMAPPGWKLVDLDYSQAELVILAFAAGDTQMIKAVVEGDLHDFVLKTFLKKAKIYGDVRGNAKSTNFHKVYGGGPWSLAARLGLEVEEVEKWFRIWDETFPMVPIWGRDQRMKWRQDKNYRRHLWTTSSFSSASN